MKPYETKAFGPESFIELKQSCQDFHIPLTLKKITTVAELKNLLKSQVKDSVRALVMAGHGSFRV